MDTLSLVTSGLGHTNERSPRHELDESALATSYDATDFIETGFGCGG